MWNIYNKCETTLQKNDQACYKPEDGFNRWTTVVLPTKASNDVMPNKPHKFGTEIGPLSRSVFEWTCTFGELGKQF